MKAKALVLALGLTLFLGGCMVGPDLVKPELETPESFHYDPVEGDSTINLAWWELFNDPALDTLIRSALSYNYDLLRAMSRVEQAYLTLGVSKADLYPQFGYDLSMDYSQPDPLGSGSGPGALMTLTPNVYWELDFWGKVRRANQAARAEILASEEALKMVQISVITAVAEGYFLLLDYDQRLSISKLTWETRQESREIIGHRYAHGVVPEIDLNQAQQQEAIAASSVPMYERLVAQTEHYLSILTGQDPGRIERGRLSDQAEPPAIPVGLPSELLQRRPDLIQAEQQFYAETARIGMLQAMRFPNFSITGALGAATSDLSNMASSASLIYSIGGSVLGPLFSWGKNKRIKQIQEETARQALYTYEESVKQAFREVEDALVDIETYARESEARQRQQEAARNAARLSRARYDGGQTGYLEVLDTERSLFSAELEATAVRHNHLISYVYLYKALGGGWITPEDQAD